MCYMCDKNAHPCENTGTKCGIAALINTNNNYICNDIIHYDFNLLSSIFKVRISFRKLEYRNRKRYGSYSLIYEIQNSFCKLRI